MNPPQRGVIVSRSAKQQQGADAAFQARLLLAAVRACRGEVVIRGEEEGLLDDTF
jgi:hypothetical protein